MQQFLTLPEFPGLSVRGSGRRWTTREWGYLRLAGSLPRSVPRPASPSSLKCGVGGELISDLYQGRQKRRGPEGALLRAGRAGLLLRS